MIERIKTRWKVFLLIVLLLLGGKMFWNRMHLPYETGVTKEFTLVAKKFNYTPGILHVNYGDRVIIHLVSEDVHHGFYLDGYGLQTSARPGEMGAVHFVANRKGRFSFRCSVTCGSFHPYMVGYLKVGPNTRFAGSVMTILFLGVGFGAYLLLKTSRGGGL